jgi:hypothetical protein
MAPANSAAKPGLSAATLRKYSLISLGICSF